MNSELKYIRYLFLISLLSFGFVNNNIAQNSVIEANVQDQRVSLDDEKDPLWGQFHCDGDLNFDNLELQWYNFDSDDYGQTCPTSAGNINIRFIESHWGSYPNHKYRLTWRLVNTNGVVIYLDDYIMDFVGPSEQLRHSAWFPAPVSGFYRCEFKLEWTCPLCPNWLGPWVTETDFGDSPSDWMYIDVNPSNVVLDNEFYSAYFGYLFYASESITLEPGFEYGPPYEPYSDNDMILIIDYCSNSKYEGGLVQEHDGEDLPDFKSSALSVEGALNTQLLNVFPNPTSNGIFTMVLNEDDIESVVRVYNMHGYIVFENTNFNDRQIDINLSGFGEGVFFLQLTKDGIVSTKKIVVTK